MTHKFKDKSLSGLQKKKTFACAIFSKICYVARPVNPTGKLICLRISLHERDRADLIDKSGMGRAYLFTPYWKYMDQSIKYPILFSQNFINVYCRGSRRQKNIFILNNSLTSIPLKTIYILKVPLKENLDSWNYSIYKYKFWFGPSEICPSSVF